MSRPPVWTLSGFDPLSGASCGTIGGVALHSSRGPIKSFASHWAPRYVGQPELTAKVRSRSPNGLEPIESAVARPPSDEEADVVTCGHAASVFVITGLCVQPQCSLRESFFVDARRALQHQRQGRNPQDSAGLLAGPMGSGVAHGADTGPPTVPATQSGWGLTALGTDDLVKVRGNRVQSGA